MRVSRRSAARGGVVAVALLLSAGAGCGRLDFDGRDPDVLAQGPGDDAGAESGVDADAGTGTDGGAVGLDDAGPETDGGPPRDAGGGCFGPFLPPTPGSLPGAGVRVGEGIVALYEMATTGGVTVEDTSGVAVPLDLAILDDPARWDWVDPGLEVTSGILVSSGRPPRELHDAIVASGELTVEIWVTPANTTQSGPARVVSYSEGRGDRNFTLGQDDVRWTWRLRTDDSSDTGQPEVSTGSGTARADGTPQHVAAVYLPTGGHRIYVDGAVAATAFDCSGLAGWDPGFSFHLANESDRSRTWLGTIHLVAVYDRALHPDEVAHNHAVGVPVPGGG